MIKAKINPDSPRHAAWLAVFRFDTMPIQSPLPIEIDGPEGKRQFYRLSVRALTPEVRARLIDYLAGRFGLSPEEVTRELDNPDHGCPILADDVIVSVDARSL